MSVLATHPNAELVFASSREQAGQPIKNTVKNWPDEQTFSVVQAEDLKQMDLDVCYLALPNGYARPYVSALEGSDCQLIDLSGDHRFDDEWTYGLPEHNRAAILSAKYICNPGCYATAMQVAIRPFLDILDSPPACFGISGYSGAGTKPSPKNDPQHLHENILPYALANHLHEAEVSRQLEQPVHFSPHVASFFRGISMTVNLNLSEQLDYTDAMQRLDNAYENEPLITVSRDIPEVTQIRDQHGVIVGGVTIAQGGRRVVLVSVLDNLLKGAATQAVQNMNLLSGLPELTGITV